MSVFSPFQIVLARVGVAFAVAVLAACGGTASTPGGGTPASASSAVVADFNPCTLPTTAELTALAGQEPIAAGGPNSLPQAHGMHEDCSWGMGPNAGVLLIVRGPVTRIEFDQDRRQMATSYQVSDVGGIGDAAFEYGHSSPNSSTTVDFLRGRYEGLIMASIQEADSGFEGRVKTFAATLATRLPR